RAGAAWRLACQEGPPVEAEQVVLAAPAPETAALLAPLAPDVAAVLRAVPTAPIAVACLAFATTDIGIDLDAYGFLVARGEGVKLLGCQYESSIFEHRAPDGSVLLRALLGGVFDPALVDASDDALSAQAVADLRRVAGLARDPEWVAVW